MQSVDKIDLKICLLNAENLFLLFESEPPSHYQSLNESQWQRLSTSIYENKPLFKTQKIAQALKEINSDIILLCEVGGRESLENFNKYFLNSEYSVALIEGNSDRNIDVGFLVRKNLPFYFDLHTNKNRLINYLYPHERDSLRTGYPLVKVTGVSHKFSRDCAELHLFAKDPLNPFLIILLTHLKSRLDPDRVDPGGFERRQAELKTLVEIYNETKVKFPQARILLAGDFNGNAARANTDEEFKPLYSETDLEDCLEIAKLPEAERATFYQVRSAGRSDGRQIDFCFLDQTLSSHLDLKQCHVYRWSDNFGSPLPAPRNLEQKLLMPSDHYPVVLKLLNLTVLPQKKS